MAATRKLQGEIDRCLKKVTEGVETFEDIWQKVHNATNSNQKEKYEADLKKEIKKLQRLRDQIKSWIASGEIKDKSTLLEYRKLIETQMERFKVVERETKTKAYSKEGLGAAQKLDPAQKEREEMSAWLVSSIDALNLQVDQFESEIESMVVGKKKRLDKEKQDRMEELKLKLEKHRFHIKKLETLLRMLDNMSVEVEQVCPRNDSYIQQIRRIKEDVEYYIDSSLEPGFEENEYIYDDIRGLDEIELSGVGLPSSATTDSNNSNDSGGSPTSMLSGTTSPITSPALEVHNHSTDSIDVEKKKKEEVIAKPVKPMALRAATAVVGNSSPNVSSLLNNSAASTNSISNSGLSGASTPSKQPPPSPPHAPHVRQPNNTETYNPVESTAHLAGMRLSLALSRTSPRVRTSVDVTSRPPVVENGPVSSAPAHTPHLPPPVQPVPTSKSSAVTLIPNSTPTSAAPALPPAPAPAPPSPAPLALNGPTLHHHALNNGRVSEASTASAASSTARAADAGGTASLKSMAQEAVQRAGLDAPHQNVRRGVSVAQAHIPPLLGVAPLGPLPLTSEHQLQFQMMESSFYHMPHPSDSERARAYLPRNICQTPIYYNQVLLPHSESVEFFQRLSTETLFFVFYYMEGTKAQYLAAKALKKQSWRFHTKYMMWFQRHEEPKVINEEYEQGTYIYFDYEKWGQRKKEGFTFEYKYLEDRDLN
ncbi:CCR4-NOT transcription complex subunit 3 isoform X2 [Ostrinia furnacalis]|uniref:CCR4-NOT transcription complex subunit 3 isoform X2 n=1 Tax=Ostrinia furnacalis TaxID=93504 RepID=UPI001038A565|nr:CCR4-NOT transcription complex subunit 3 isoform X2 [Ostrinia furnacalis]